MAKSVFRRLPSDLEDELPEWNDVNIDGQTFVKVAIGARAWEIAEDFWEAVAGGGQIVAADGNAVGATTITSVAAALWLTNGSEAGVATLDGVSGATGVGDAVSLGTSDTSVVGVGVAVGKAVGESLGSSDMRGVWLLEGQGSGAGETNTEMASATVMGSMTVSAGTTHVSAFGDLILCMSRRSLMGLGA